MVIATLRMILSYGAGAEGLVKIYAVEDWRRQRPKTDRRTENPRVGGSIPPCATTIRNYVGELQTPVPLAVARNSPG